MYSLNVGGHAPAGFPHSEISGSKPVSGSPELIAAVHVLRRLWLPRHPPYALRSLTLSLRHASSSRAGFDLRASNRCAPLIRFSFATLGRYDLPEMSIDISFRSILFSKNWAAPLLRGRGGHRPPCRSIGGADRDRTDDLRLAKPALSQLSYSPIEWWLARLQCGPGQS